MKASMKVTGYPQTLTMLRSVGDKVVETARKQMHRSAARIVKLAKRMAPREQGHLEDSIRIEKSYGSRGRLQIDVVAGGTEFVDSHGHTRSTDQYAWIVHDYFGLLEPGPGTLAKQAANPDVRVGERFLERAAATEEEKLARNMVEAVTQTIKESRK